MYPSIEPFASGWLPVSDSNEIYNEIYWETSGNPDGKPALYVHGGPGGGLRTGHRRWFDPRRHLIIAFEQRGCGRSRPLAIDDLSTLRTNTTQALIDDMEALRAHLGVERWLLAGASWGTTLSLAYAQAHPERVSEIVLMATGLTDAAAVEWYTETVGRIFPLEWDEFRAAAHARPGQRLVDAYHEQLIDPDATIREQAAIAWDLWENAHISLGPHQTPRSVEPVRRQVFATLVTHYWKHAGFLPDGALIAGMPVLQGIPGVLVQGKLDVSGPAGTAWELHKLWPDSRFVLIDDEGHGGLQMIEAVVAATDQF